MLASSSRRTIETVRRRAAEVVSRSDAWTAKVHDVRHVARAGCSIDQTRYASAQAKTIARSDTHKPTRLTPRGPTPNPRLVQFQRGTPLTHFNLRLRQHADERFPRRAYEVALEMKKQGISPNLTTYNCLIDAMANDGLFDESRAVFNDMLLMGFQPDIDTYNSMLKAARFESPEVSLSIFDEILDMGFPPTALTYEYLLRRYLQGENLEMSLQYLAEMNALGMNPPLKIVQKLLMLVAEQGLPRLALDLAESYEQTSIRRLESEIWVKILISSAQELYLEGVERCWEKVVKELRIVPHEGLCMAVLHTAARHGLFLLAADVLQQLEKLELVIGEHHITPLLEAFYSSGHIKEAFTAIDVLRASGVPLRQDMFAPIVHAIQHKADAVDEAWKALESMKAEGTVMDIIAGNIVIEATVRMGDLRRAVGIYKALPDLGLRPDVTTYNLLLLACLQNKHRELGDRIMVEMTEASVQKDAETYEYLIKLCLTQSSYEDVFFHLEHMKTEGFKPSYSVYDTLIRKCVASADMRYKLALEELDQMGYELLPPLQAFIKSIGQELGHEGQIHEEAVGRPLLAERNGGREYDNSRDSRRARSSR